MSAAGRGLVVHHLETSRSQRILWLLEELGVPYELKVYKQGKTTRPMPKRLRARPAYQRAEAKGGPTIMAA